MVGYIWFIRSLSCGISLLGFCQDVLSISESEVLEVIHYHYVRSIWDFSCSSVSVMNLDALELEA